MRALCVTGHRPQKLFGYDRYAYAPLMQTLQGVLTQTIEAYDLDTVITGGAQGADQLAFWATNAIKRDRPELRNVVYVPFRGQERLWPTQGLFGQSDYRHMLEAADNVRICAAVRGDNVAGALLRRNHMMVDAAIVVVAVADEQNLTGGGTAATVRYARRCRKPVVFVDPYAH